jgi:hypothetical protein
VSDVTYEDTMRRYDTWTGNTDVTVFSEHGSNWRTLWSPCRTFTPEDCREARNLQRLHLHQNRSMNIDWQRSGTAINQLVQFLIDERRLPPHGSDLYVTVCDLIWPCPVKEGTEDKTKQANRYGPRSTAENHGEQSPG